VVPSGPSPTPSCPKPAAYTGRFAPSPTGPLHFGSLIAAVGSYLQAKKAGGRWLVRIEDIDRPREVPGAANDILRTLEALGFEWDGPIEKQSQRLELYEHALDRLRERRRIYSCSCSRGVIAALAPGSDEPRYPGLCRNGPRDASQPLALRLQVEPGVVAFTDSLQGRIEQDVNAAVGDFVIKRRDGLHAYHLAVVVDDADQGITEVVRGADLLDSTPRQLLLFSALELPAPSYAHLPLAVDSEGRKLSKSQQSLAIDVRHASTALWHALAFLRQTPPPSLLGASTREIWTWAQSQWNSDALQGIKLAAAPPGQIS
jgi:glutamyl-Q tRNA(Asp) synthetase